MKKILFTMALSVVLLPLMSMAQTESAMDKCREHIVEPFISDGQSYTVLLTEEDVAEFYVTFYGGTTYRLVGYCGEDDGNLAFSVYDQERNMLFTNRDFENTPYWDFKFENTMDCIIEAEIDSKEIKSGIAVMLVGFKPQGEGK